MKKLLLVGTAFVSMSGCASTGAVSNPTIDNCAKAQQELTTERTTLMWAQLAVSNLEALAGSAAAIAKAQQAVSLATADVAAIQAMVNTVCTMTPPRIMAMRAPTITLVDAKRMVDDAKKRLADTRRDIAAR